MTTPYFDETDNTSHRLKNRTIETGIQARIIRVSVILLGLILPIATLYNVSGSRGQPFLPTCELTPSALEVWNVPNAVLGEPKARFRENIKEGQKYLTSLPAAGWTNDVMAFGNLVYLSILTDRIPVLPPFAPTHVGEEVAPMLPFGEVFDVPRLSQSLRQPVLEWRDLKTESTMKEQEIIGCWDVWSSEAGQSDARTRRVREHLALDVSYTQAPQEFVDLFTDKPDDKHRSFWAVAALGYPEKRAQYLPTIVSRPSLLTNTTRPPDEDMMCVDYMYYFGVVTDYEYTTDFGPAWRWVGQHMRWNATLQGIADQYIRKILDIPDVNTVPEYIAVHVRRTDFRMWCDESASPDECFAPIYTINRRVGEVREETLWKKGIDVPASRVIITSDEVDLAWWGEIHKLGWKGVNHTTFDTAGIYDPWYPVLIDAVIQSSGVGFVGTDRSTMSLMAQRRVSSWRQGATRMVKWGKKGADDH